jgi:VWFA-related protein
MLTLALLALAQPPEPPVFKTSTRLVQVNVLVLDKQGRPVSGLRKEDFTATDQGKKQSIAVFAEEGPDRADAPAPKLPPNIFLNTAKPRGPGVVSAILLDMMNTGWADQVQAKQQVMKFLLQIKPEDRVALLTLGRKVSILHDYTNDVDKLLRSIRGWQAKNEPGSVGVEWDPSMGDDPVVIPEAERNMQQTLRIQNTLRALEAVGQYLAGVPGRKNLIWVTAGFPMMVGGGGRVNPFFARDFQTFLDEFDRTFRALNNANVAVYPVDARGLLTSPDARINIEAMQEAAERTGGRAFYNRNDIGTAIRQVQEESAVSYTLGYYPDNSGRAGEFREIRVKVSRPGVTVRARRGYSPKPPVQSEQIVRRQQLQAAARDPFNATGLTVGARVDKDDATRMLEAKIMVDSEHLTLDRTKDSRWVGAFDVLVVQLDSRGLELENTIDTVQLNLLESTYQTLRQKSPVFNKQFMRKDSAETVRIVVRDHGSGLTGSLSVPLLSLQ